MATTLADHLRSLPDEALGALLQLRPDLVMPVPADLSALAVRIQSRGSVARCLDGLDQFTLQVLDAARLTRDPAERTTSTQAVLAFAGTGELAAPVRAAMDRLRALFLLYGPVEALSVVDGVDEVSSPYPLGLGRPAADLDARTAALCADPARLRRAVLAAAPPARAVLDRLAAGPPVGRLASAPMAEPVRWLVDNALLVPAADSAGGAGDGAAGDSGVVELPREVGLLLRRESGPLGPVPPQAPVVAGPSRDPKAADSAGAGQAMEAVRHAEALLEALAAEPAAVLRSGGLGVRDLRRLARTVGLDEPAAALLLEIGYAAGLLGEADAAGTGRSPAPVRLAAAGEQPYLPTGRYDLWRATSLAVRWEQLAQAWLAMPRQVGLVGQRDERDRPIAVLSAELERAGAPATRQAVLEILAGLPAGTAPTADDVLAVLTWRSPRRNRGREAAIRETLAEAALLGITGSGALTSYGRLLQQDTVAAATRGAAAEEDPLGVRAEAARAPGQPSAAVETLAGLLPDPVDHVLVQADLTVVVPGPPETALAAELEAVAEQESAGGASVHRVTVASIRRALDAGYAADDLHRLFRQRSRTPVPQALTYLIDDVARKHGGLRAGTAGAYLRSDDEALLAEVLADRRMAELALRRLAPTVLCTVFPVGRLLDTLRGAGYAPVQEDPNGSAVLTRPKARRAPPRMPVSARLVDPSATPKLTAPRLAGVVEQLRRGDAAARAARRAPVTVRAANGTAAEGLTAVQAHTQALAVLQQAVRERTMVWVGYVDAHGATTTRLVRPVSIGAGYLRAEDDRTETLHTFALHRITAAIPE